MFKALTSLSTTSLMAAGALAIGLGLAVPAKADVTIGVGIYPAPQADIGWSGGYNGGSGGYVGDYGGNYGGYHGGYNGGYNGHYGGGYGYRPRPYPVPVYGGWVNCREGRRILWRYGYSDVEVQSCRSGVYRYTAWRRGKQYLMAVDAQGDVARLRRIY